MSVPVGHAPEFYEDLAAQTAWYSEHVSDDYAGRWYDAAIAKVAGLDHWPRGYGYARDEDAAEFPGPGELREAPFGLGRRPSHRVIFRVRLDGEEAASVDVLAVRPAG